MSDAAFPTLPDGAALDVLAVAAHPDDAEIGCGGTLLRLVAAGYTVGVVDCTRGESGSRGSPEIRAAEAAAAAARLGLAHRENLGLPDGFVAAGDDDALRRLVTALRRLRPRWLFAPYPVDAHPDHEAVAGLCRRAFFHSGLARVFPEAGAAKRPEVLLRYAGNDLATPALCVDISAFAAAKRDLIACYASQIGRTPAERAHYLRGLDPISRAEARDRFYGAACGVAAAEPLWTDGPVSLDLLAPLVAPGAGAAPLDSEGRS